MNRINTLYRQIQNNRAVQSTKLFLNTPAGKSIVAIGLIIALGLYLFRGSWYPKTFSAKRLSNPQTNKRSSPSSPPPLVSGPPPLPKKPFPDPSLIDRGTPLLSETLRSNDATPPPLPQPRSKDAESTSKSPSAVLLPRHSQPLSKGPGPALPPRRDRHQRTLSSPLTNVSALLASRTGASTDLTAHPTDSMPSSLSQLFAPNPSLLMTTSAPSSTISNSSNPSQASSFQESYRTTSTVDLLSGSRASAMIALKREQNSPDRKKSNSRPPSGNWDDWEVDYPSSPKPLTEEDQQALDELRKYADSPQTSQPSSSSPAATPSDSSNVVSRQLPPHLDPSVLAKLLRRQRSTQDTVVFRGRN